VKIRHRLLLVLAAGCAALSVLTAILLNGWIVADTVTRYRAELRDGAAVLAAWLETAPPAGGLQPLAFQSGHRLGLRVTLIGGDGNVLGDSFRQGDELPAMDSHLTRPEIAAAAKDGTGWSVRRSDTFAAQFLYVAARVEGPGAVRFVRVGVPYDQVLASAAALRNRVFLLTLASLVLLSAVAYVGARRLSRPVERMAAAAERAAAGEPADLAVEDASGEVGRLSIALARMKGSLTEKIAESEEERAFLRSVLSGMREGLLLVGADRRIRLANDAFRQIFGLPSDPSGRLLAEVIRDPAVLRDLETARAEGREVRDSVIEAASGRSFELHVTPLPARGSERPGEALFLFYDVTKLEALEGVRREFVANVSHELRTPLTSIKAFVETLLDARLEDRENSLKFLEIVRKHADRMSALIDDLTDLSLIETGSISLRPQDVEIGELAAEVTANLEPKLASAKVEARVEVPKGLRVRADRMRMEQVLVNLVDNAIKFNRPGGHVRISGAIEDGRTVVTVEDSGVGIPADSAEKVFHRFYRVDKGRSKELGGTGLGLSIVKHLMRLHGGQVRLESELGQGSKFILEFPPDAVL
jgi:two-component system phosphate regulon sensor histidine kinase PhoR